MLKLFEIRNEDSSFELRARRAGLPGVACAACGATWSWTAIDYPLAGLADGTDPGPFEDRSPVPVEAYRLLARAVVGLPRGCEVMPGTEFGPLRGSVRGTVRDVNFGFFNLILRRTAFDALRAEGLEIEGAPVLLRSAKAELVEVQVEPHGRLSSSCLPGGQYPSPCAGCGRLAIVIPKNVVLDGATIRTKKDIFRGRDASTHIFVTERFRTACERLGLRGMAYRPMPVACA